MATKRTNTRKPRLLDTLAKRAELVWQHKLLVGATFATEKEATEFLEAVKAAAKARQ